MAVQRDKNALRFAITSFIIQMMILTLIGAAQGGIAFRDNSVSSAYLNTQTGIISEEAGTTYIETDQSIVSGEGMPNAYNPIDAILAVPTFAMSFWSVMLNMAFSYVGLFYLIGVSGPYGWFIAVMLLIWQVAALYHLLKFIFPGRIG